MAVDKKKGERKKRGKGEKEPEEGKKNIENTEDKKLQKTSPDYLFQLETKSSKLHLFCISKKHLQIYELGFIFSSGMGFYHVENSFYLGGGSLRGHYFSNFRKILPNGEVTELQKMSK